MADITVKLQKMAMCIRISGLKVKKEVNILGMF